MIYTWCGMKASSDIKDVCRHSHESVMFSETDEGLVVSGAVLVDPANNSWYILDNLSRY